MDRENFKNAPSLFAASGLFLLAAIGLWLTSAVHTFDLSAFSEEAKGLLVSLCYYAPFVILPATVWAGRRGDVQRALRLNSIRFSEMLTACFAAILSLMVVQNATTLWMVLWQRLGLNVFTDSYVRPANASELMLSVISAAIIAPIGEELLFRGAMLSAWERKGQRAAVMVTAVLFAMLHGSVIGLPGEIFGGMMMALLVLWTDSLYAGLAFHSVYNAGSVMLNYISTGVPADAAEEALMQADLLAYLGGFEGALSLLLSTMVALALILMLTRGMRLRYALRCAVRSLPVEALQGTNLQELRSRMKVRPPVDPTPMTTGAALVLMAGIVSCLGMYVLDILVMLGG